MGIKWDLYHKVDSIRFFFIIVIKINYRNAANHRLTHGLLNKLDQSFFSCLEESIEIVAPHIMRRISKNLING